MMWESRGNLAKSISDALDASFEETPDPFSSTWLLDQWHGIRRTYREYLDEQPRNWRGVLIPRIVTVRRNLRSLGKPPKPPQLPA